MITKKQYATICTKGLGLRSNSSPHIVEMSAASYSMDLSKEPMDALKGAPSNWDDLLEKTIAQILAFDNAKGRFLAIVTGSRGHSYDYVGCFPKCSSIPSAILVSEEITSTTTVGELVRWVQDNIPESISS